MNFKLEITEFNKNFPIIIILLDIEQTNMHWHVENEIVFVVEGSIEISIHGKLFILHKNNFMLINSKELHNIMKTRGGNLVIVFQYDLKYFSNVDFQTISLFICL